MPGLRLVRLAIVVTFGAHGLAMLAMLALLLPAMPGGTGASDAERMQWIAGHVTSYRLGWLPWHVTAASDLLLALALLRLPKIPLGLRWGQLALTTVALLCDQGGQALLLTRGVDRAIAGDLPGFLAVEHLAFPLTAWYAALLYTLGAIAWTFAFRAAGIWSRAVAALSVPLWALFLVATIGPLLPPGVRLPDRAVAGANALGFVGMELWFFLLWRASGRKGPVTSVR